MDDADNREWVTVAQAAATLRVTEEQIQTLVEQRFLRSRREGGEGQLLVEVAALSGAVPRTP